MTKLEYTIKILNDNACMINSLLTTEEQKSFQKLDFVSYITKNLKKMVDNTENA